MASQGNPNEAPLSSSATTHSSATPQSPNAHPIPSPVTSVFSTVPPASASSVASATVPPASWSFSFAPPNFSNTQPSISSFPFSSSPLLYVSHPSSSLTSTSHFLVNPLAPPASQFPVASSVNPLSSPPFTGQYSPLVPLPFSQNVMTRSTPLLSSLNQANSVKLDGENFLTWEAIILPIVRGHRLEGYLTGSKATPPEFLLDAAEEVHPNPAFEDWQATDQILLGWLLSMMTLEIASQFTHCKTASSLWLAVKEYVRVHTRSRITFLKGEFQRTRKGALKMKEYLAKMKSISDNLTMASAPLSLIDLITQTLAGLDNEYTPIMVLLSEKENLSRADLQSKLLTYEARMEQIHSTSNMSMTSAFANLSVQPSA